MDTPANPFSIGQVTLLPWQEEAYPALLSVVQRVGAGLDASDMGTGKSYTGAFVANAMRDGRCILVICPKAVIPSWKGIFRAMGLGEEEFFVTNYENARDRKGIPGIISVDPDGKYRFNKTRVGFIIFDEAHNIRSYEGTKNSKLAIGSKLAGVPHLYLSATMADSPAHFRAVGFSLGLHQGVDFFGWALKLGCTYDPWGKMVLKAGERVAVTRKLNAMLFPAYGIRVRKQDIPNFPECEIHAEAFDFGDSKGIERVYAEMAEELAKLEEKIEADENRVKERAKAMVAQLRARQKVELLKIPGTVGLVEDAIEEGMAVALFTNFNSTINEMLKKCKHLKPAVIRGSQSEAAREKERLRFQNGETHFILVNAQSGGAGLGLHDINGIRPRLGFVYPCYSPVIMRQVTGRLPRAGSKSKSMYKFLFASGTVETKVLRKVQGKLNDMDRINDADLLLDGEVPIDTRVAEGYEPEEGEGGNTTTHLDAEMEDASSLGFF